MRSRLTALAGWLGLVLELACGPAPRPESAEARARTPIPLDEARERFAEANALCTADRGAVWGISLCGPMMWVDGETRFLAASQADARGLLRAAAGVFVGSLPAGENIANTSFTWAGVHWVQLPWPLPVDRAVRDVVVMHEAFHRIEDQLGIAVQGSVDNPHLATAEGRYYMQLEWRALASALRATVDDQRRGAIADALAFRRARRAAHPGSAATENALELHEGLAEYTGVVVGRREPAAQVAAAIRDLRVHADDPSYVRSFAYATGPSYGLLLDRYAPGWRRTIARTRSLSDALAAATSGPQPDADQAAAAYGGPALRLAEEARASQLAARLEQYRRKLVDGPVLTLGFRHVKFQFDPRTVESLGEFGAVYPTLRVADDWGVLQVTGGALIKADRTAVTVPAPAAAAGPRPIGEGWSLELAPGWTLEPDARPGDLRLAHAGE
jgi:hypothetical protein